MVPGSIGQGRAVRRQRAPGRKPAADEHNQHAVVRMRLGARALRRRLQRIPRGVGRAGERPSWYVDTNGN